MTAAYLLTSKVCNIHTIINVHALTFAAMCNYVQTVALCHVFFFQAEDGIRDLTVTGVQTCALPIYSAIVVMDGRGAWEATSIWHGHSGRIDHVLTIPYPNSIGLFYSEFTEYLGFQRKDRKSVV